MKVPAVRIGPARLLPAGSAACEADVWRALAKGEDLVVPEEPLGAWARKIATTRGWPIELIEDPRERIARDHPTLSPHLDGLNVDHAPTSLWAWARREIMGLPHAAVPSSAHAEHLARWRLAGSLSDAHAALLALAAEEFASPELVEIYRLAASRPTEAVLARLVGDNEPTFGEPWDTFDEPVLAQKIAAWTRARHATEKFEGLRRALTSSAPVAGRSSVARALVAARVELPQDAREVLSPLLEGADYEALLELVPPAPPTRVPHDPERLSDWYVSDYLPYRAWMQGREGTSDPVAEKVWEEFEEAYLRAFGKWLDYGTGDLALYRSRALRQGADGTVLVVLDGPLPSDVDRLLARLRALLPAWSVPAPEWTLAAVPTVTEVNRPSVVCGTPALDTPGDDGVSTFAQARARLQVGEAFVAVKLVQPDRIYDIDPSPLDRLRLLARKEIDLIAEEIADLLRSGVARSLVVTADHGRCWGPVEPVVPRPNGVPHGRAMLEVDKSEAAVGEGARRLDGERYRFSSSDAVVARGARGFEGTERVWYLHGGLLPEEAFVPWVVLVPESRPVEIRAEIRISGVLGRPGEIALHIENLSEREVRLHSIEWHANGERVSVALSRDHVPAASPYEVSAKLDQIREAYPSEGRLVFSGTDGLLTSVSAPLTANVRRMQTQAIDLTEDL